MLIFSVSFQFLRMTTEVVPAQLTFPLDLNACFGMHFENHAAANANAKTNFTTPVTQDCLIRVA